MSRCVLALDSALTSMADCDQERRDAQEEEEEEEEECPVCFEPLEGVGRATRRLNCRHVFHHDCIQEWLVRDPRCPFCKSPCAPAASASVAASAGVEPSRRSSSRREGSSGSASAVAPGGVFVDLLDRPGIDSATGAALVACTFRLIVDGTILVPQTSLNLLKGHRYGLVGRNGVGKSILLSQIAAGAIPRADGSRVALVAQEELPGFETVLERILSGDERRTKLVAELEGLEATLDACPDVADRVVATTEELERIGGFDAEERAAELAKGMGFSEDDLRRQVSELSGGWRMRLSVTRALFADPDVLLLDEVTNHLDLEALFWLQKHLAAAPAETTIVVVSHDAHFLDQVITDVAYLSREGLHCVRGNYSTFEEQTEQQRARQENLLRKKQTQEESAKKAIDESQRRARATGDEKLARAAKQWEAKLHRIGLHRDDGKRYKLFSTKCMGQKWLQQPQRVEKLQADAVLRFKLPTLDPPPAAHGELMALQGACFAYGNVLADQRHQGEARPSRGGKGKRQATSAPPGSILWNVSVAISGRTRCAVVGQNGAGKSTLLRLISGHLQPTEPCTVRRRPQAVIASVTQHHLEALESFLDMSPAAYLRLRKGDLLRNEREARTYLGRFGLPGRLALTPLAELSGGLRTRLVLAEALLLPVPPTLLLLDEPTNHLDFESIEALALGLELFEGAVVVVSHNVSFLSTICDELWIVRDRGVEVLKETPGGDGFPEHFARYADQVRRGSSLYRKRGARRAVAAAGVETRSQANFGEL